ncbi:MAG: hypothetical protein KDK91_32285 [Gammaproteobacteria bacterium]|nr:hypothetical protein [Gammaproteobacteria bacterium]
MSFADHPYRIAIMGSDLRDALEAVTKQVDRARRATAELTVEAALDTITFGVPGAEVSKPAMASELFAFTIPLAKLGMIGMAEFPARKLLLFGFAQGSCFSEGMVMKSPPVRFVKVKTPRAKSRPREGNLIPGHFETVVRPLDDPVNEPLGLVWLRTKDRPAPNPHMAARAAQAKEAHEIAAHGMQILGLTPDDLERLLDQRFGAYLK